MAGADASIYNLIRQPKPGPGPLDQYAQAMQLKTLMGQQGLQEVQMRGALREEQTGEKLRSLFSTNPNPSDAEVMGIDPVKSGPAYMKQKREGTKADADLQKVDRENFISLADASRKRMATIRDPQSWQAYRDEIIQAAGMFKTPEIRAMALRSAQAMPAQFDPGYIRDSLVKNEELFTPKMVERGDGQRKWMEDTNPFTNPAIRGGAQTQMQQTPESVASEKSAAAGRAVSIRGQNMTDARARETAGAGKWTNDLDRGLQINMATGETRPMTAAGVPVGGKKDDAKAEKLDKARLGAEQAGVKAQVVIDKVDEALAKTGFWTTGLTGDIRGAGPGRLTGSSAYDLEKTIDTIKANLGFKELGDMRASSPTGGALGQITERELQFLQASVSALDKGQSEELVRQNLNQVKTHFQNWKAAMDEAAGARGAPARGASGGWDKGVPDSAPTPAPTRSQIDAELRRRGVIK